MNDADQIELTCPRCQKRQRVPRDQAGQRVLCTNASCRTPLDIPLQATTGGESRPVAPYSMLRALAVCFQALAVLGLAWALGGVAFGLIWAFAVPLPWPLVLGAAAAVSLGLLGCIACLSAAELIKLAIDLEANGRAVRAGLARDGQAEREKVA